MEFKKALLDISSGISFLLAVWIAYITFEDPPDSIMQQTLVFNQAIFWMMVAIYSAILSQGLSKTNQKPIDDSPLDEIDND